ncbi:hypothetical protein KIN20_011440 [Parelaphostrongylus tenuis]|uniref:Uncharacterized protein n=1 Tax=Parelaphostrongylus tenuis TaxID=148309 RepID=A0AAD5QL04_PARTN|nr:hypothetical protein KIN20_011440 [Parelaphostrongylus tenuis]
MPVAFRIESFHTEEVLGLSFTYKPQYCIQSLKVKWATHGRQQDRLRLLSTDEWPQRPARVHIEVFLRGWNLKENHDYGKHVLVLISWWEKQLTSVQIHIH